MLFLDGWLAFAALAHLASVALLIATSDDASRTKPTIALPLVVASFSGAVGAYWATATGWTIMPALLVFLAALGLFVRRSGLRPAGLVVWSSFLMLSGASLVWGAWFMLGLQLSLISTLAPSQIWTWLGVVFAVVIIGRLGNPIGALAAGVLIGACEGLAMAVISPAWAPVVSFSILIAILLWQPRWL